MFTLAFELSFPLLALTRKGRPWAAVAGLAFHGCAACFFRIPFLSLAAMYVVLVNPVRWLRRRPLDGPPDEHPAGRWVRVVGSLLVAGAFVQGARGRMRSYPFACYPTFEWMVGTEMPDLLLQADAGDGGPPVVVRHARDSLGRRSQRQWGEIWSLAGVGGPVDLTRLRAYVESVVRGERRPAGTRVRCYRIYVSVVPEERAAPPRRGPLLAEFVL